MAQCQHQLQVFAWDNEDAQEQKAGIVHCLARSGQIETL